MQCVTTEDFRFMRRHFQDFYRQLKQMYNAHWCLWFPVMGLGTLYLSRNVWFFRMWQRFVTVRASKQNALCI